MATSAPGSASSGFSDSGRAWPGSVERSCHDLRSGPDPHSTSAYPRGSQLSLLKLLPLWHLFSMFILFIHLIHFINFLIYNSFHSLCMNGHKKVKLDVPYIANVLAWPGCRVANVLAESCRSCRRYTDPMTNPTWWRPLRGSSAVAVVESPPKRSPRRTVKTTSGPVQRWPPFDSPILPDLSRFDSI